MCIIGAAYASAISITLHHLTKRKTLPRMLNCCHMTNSFYFYDLETTGINPREARVMQFAGQRTGLDLQPICGPHDFLIRITEDILPDPDAILVTGITPQQTITEGLTEAEFLKIFSTEISIAGTIFVGYNSVRFDDEFMRYLLYRNFYDPYEWQWQDDRSRWDLLDLVRMTRALRPEGIKWPFAPDGKPSNSLGLITSVNDLSHANAHNALNDVQATVDVARLLKEKQPKLFDYSLKLRDKKRVAEFVNLNSKFLYTSGKYNSEFEKTTIVTTLTEHPKKQGVLVYDLRFDPSEFASMSAHELAEVWRWKKDKQGPVLPIKTLAFNRCPAVAPLSVLDDESKQRLQLDMKVIDDNQKKLSVLKSWTKRIIEALQILDGQQQASLVLDERTVDEQLYDGFFDKPDKMTMNKLRTSSPTQLNDFREKFNDPRLQALVPLYKARNYPKQITDEERAIWEKYRSDRLLSGIDQSRLARYFKRLSELAERTDLTANQQYILEELQLYGQSILPE